MKKVLLSFLLTLLPIFASAQTVESEIKNSEGVSLSYSWANNERTELAVTSSYYSSYSGDVVIPSSALYDGKYYSVTTIGSGAFNGCGGLTSITIPNSITKIGDQAFQDCSSLTSLVIPNSVTEIGFKAFYGCSALSTISFSNSLTTIRFEAFGGTSWYNNQPDGLIYIGKIAYKYKGEMPANTEITIKDGTTDIAETAFSGCYNMISICIPKSVISIGSLVFDGCDNLRKVISEITTPFKLDTPFSTYSYTSSESFNRVTLIVPDGKKEIYQSTDGWKNFTNIVELGKGGIEGQTFFADGIIFKINENKSVSVAYNYGSLEFYVGEIDIPARVSFNGMDYSVTSIDGSAFSGCRNLTSVIIPEGVVVVSYQLLYLTALLQLALILSQIVVHCLLLLLELE